MNVPNKYTDVPNKYTVLHFGGSGKLWTLYKVPVFFGIVPLLLIVHLWKWKCLQSAAGSGWPQSGLAACWVASRHSVRAVRRPRLEDGGAGEAMDEGGKGPWPGGRAGVPSELGFSGHHPHADTIMLPIEKLTDAMLSRSFARHDPYQGLMEKWLLVTKD